MRITKTLDLGPYLWYGGVILGIEMLGATTIVVRTSLCLHRFLPSYALQHALCMGTCMTALPSECTVGASAIRQCLA